VQHPGTSFHGGMVQGIRPYSPVGDYDTQQAMITQAAAMRYQAYQGFLDEIIAAGESLTQSLITTVTEPIGEVITQAEAIIADPVEQIMQIASTALAPSVAPTTTTTVAAPAPTQPYPAAPMYTTTQPKPPAAGLSALLLGIPFPILMIGALMFMNKR